MELVSFDDETITIRMDRRKEFGPISRIVSAAAIDSAALDEVITQLSAEEVSQLEDAIQEVDESISRKAV